MGLLAGLDAALEKKQVLCIIGSCALLLMGHDTRSTEDVDVWLPASSIDGADLMRACRIAGIGFNPTDEDAGDGEAYLQVVQPGVVRLPSCANGTWSTGEESETVWTGRNLTVTMPPVAVLVASKLARCEDRDLTDCAFLMSTGRTDEAGVRAAARRMPAAQRQTATENVVLLGLLRQAA